MEHPMKGRKLCGEDEIFELRRCFYGEPPKRKSQSPTPVSVWNAIYKRELISSNGIWFISTLSEDKFFNTATCRMADTVCCVGDSNYFYRKDDQPSITNTFDEKTIDSFFDMFARLEQMSREEPPKFKDESRLCTKGCIIDYCRVLVGRIESSATTGVAKRRYVKDAFGRPLLRWACHKYPFAKLPLPQMMFFFCEKFRLVSPARVLVRVRSGIKKK